MPLHKKRRKRTIRKLPARGFGSNVLGLYLYRIKMPNKSTISGATPFVYRDEAEEIVSTNAKKLGGKITRFERG